MARFSFVFVIKDILPRWYFLFFACRDNERLPKEAPGG